MENQNLVRILLQKLDEIESEMRSQNLWKEKRSTDLHWHLPVLEFFQFEKIPADRNLLREGQLPYYHGQWVYDIRHDCTRDPKLRKWVQMALSYNDLLPTRNEFEEESKNADREFQKKHPLLFSDALTETEAGTLLALVSEIEKEVAEISDSTFTDTKNLDLLSLSKRAGALYSLQFKYLHSQKESLNSRNWPRPVAHMDTNLRILFHRDPRWDRPIKNLKTYQERLYQNPLNKKEFELEEELYLSERYVYPARLSAEEVNTIFSRALKTWDLEMNPKGRNPFTPSLINLQRIDELVIQDIKRNDAKKIWKDHTGVDYLYPELDIKYKNPPLEDHAFDYEVCGYRSTIDFQKKS